MAERTTIQVRGAHEHNLKNFDVDIERGKITVITGVSGSGKSSLAFDTVLAEAHRRFFYTLSHYSRQFLDLGTRPQVRQVHGLSPAIGLAQNETQPSRRATVGTLSDISELIGVLMARFGQQNCPKHHVSTAAQSIEDMAARLMTEADQETVMIGAVVAKAKKGHFANQLTKFTQKGYNKALIDGKVVSLEPIPKLVKEEKHSITVIIDILKIKAGAEKRLERSLKSALELGEGFGEYCLCNAQGVPQAKECHTLSTEQGCPSCGFSWPKLDARYFSSNSLGRCPTCQGYGELGIASDEDDEIDEEQYGETCPSCQGSGLRDDIRAITFYGQSAVDLQNLTLRQLLEFMNKLPATLWQKNPAIQRVREEIISNTQRLLRVGLDYLTLARRVRTLSSGEAQRLRLAGVLGEKLRGVLYVLDEPSQGLHPSELDQVWEVLEELKNLGNTLIIVDHDADIIRRADRVIDLGPGGGHEGGYVVATFDPAAAKKFESQSLTAQELLQRHSVQLKSVDQHFPSFIEIKNARLHNLRIDYAKIPLGRFSVITGVSGAGKSSLVHGVLYRNIAEKIAESPRAKKKFQWLDCDTITGLETLQQVLLVDRKPIAKSSVSMPATYLDIFGELRNLFAQLKDAQIAGIDAKMFSLMQNGGRCEECQGKGEITLNMRFLAAARVLCPVCKGKRYRNTVQQIRYNDLSMSDVLELTMAQAIEVFANYPKIRKKLQPAIDLGLGYLKLGQLSMHLSGGESQRLKLVSLFHKARVDGLLVVLDEPTTGLHFTDVQRLIQQLLQLVERGATVVIIEHNPDVIQAADWMVDLGPGAAHNGGQVVYQGQPSGVLKVKQSVTGRYWGQNRVLQ